MINRHHFIKVMSLVSILRKAYSAYFLVGFLSLLIFPLALGVINSASGQQNATVTYYLNVNGTTSVCSSSNSQNVLGSLDSAPPSAGGAGLNPSSSVWNTFCTSVPIAVGTLTITSVRLTLYVCCGDGNGYALLPELIDNSTTPPTILASLGNSINYSATGPSCQSAKKIGINIPFNNNATLTSGHVLVLQFQFSGSSSATLCTGSGGFPSPFQNTPSSIDITGIPLTTTSTTTTNDTTSSSTSTSTNTSTTTTNDTTSTSTSSSSSTTTSTSTSTTTSETTSSSTSTPSSTTTSISSVQSTSTSTDSSSLPHTTSTDSSSTVTQLLPKTSDTPSALLDFNNPLLLSGVLVGLVVIASSVIALGGKRS